METGAEKNLPTTERLLQRISELEKRVARLEAAGTREEPDSYIRIFKNRVPEEDEVPGAAREGSPSVESRIGEHGMAWLGNMVLFFGILFITQFLKSRDQALLSMLIGMASVAAVLAAGYYTRSSFPAMSRLFQFNGYILLFMTAMQCTLLPGNALIENNRIGEFIVLAVLLALLFLAYRKESQALAILVWGMAVIAAIASNSTHLMLPILVGISWSALYFTRKFNWWPGLITSIVLVYFTFLIWILGDPFISHSAAIITAHQYSYLYLFACAMAYTLLVLLPRSERFSEGLLNAAIVLNGLGFSTLLVISVLAFFPKDYFLLFGVIAACCLGFSIWLQSRQKWPTITAFYTLYGFVALSICVAGAYQFPRAFMLLAIQSLLVVSAALWFRSRFIVIMNTLLFIGLLITYLALPNKLLSIDFTFALVALVTARILNWKKKRLEIRTELIRNLYLITGAGMALYGLHEAVPAHFISLSWILTAVIFFVLSLVLHNIKYRWLAIATLVVTVFYVFIVDLKSISLGYRIVALMVISVISLGISIYYARRIRTQQGSEPPPASDN